MLTKPDFALELPNPNINIITDAEWWLWLRMHELEPSSQLGGIYANKSGFHNTGQANLNNWPGNYSIRDDINRTGPWWLLKASAIDWTFPEAQHGDYSRISKYTSRLIASARNPMDPRLDLILFEFYGQSDTDLVVEGYNEYREEFVTSDSSHLWHIHISFLRSKCGDLWSMWALLTVLMGWTVIEWQATLPAPIPTPTPSPEWGDELIMILPTLRRGYTGSSVRRLQGLLVSHNWNLGNGFIDGIFGVNTDTAVRRFQTNYSLSVDGIVGRNTWTMLLTR